MKKSELKQQLYHLECVVEDGKIEYEKKVLELEYYKGFYDGFKSATAQRDEPKKIPSGGITKEMIETVQRNRRPPVVMVDSNEAEAMQSWDDKFEKVKKDFCKSMENPNKLTKDEIFTDASEWSKKLCENEGFGVIVIRMNDE